jgi:hypothetical protein
MFRAISKGVEELLRMARRCVDVDNMMRCPCHDCTNRYYRHIEVVERHLFMHGIDQAYTRWIFHREDLYRVNATMSQDNFKLDLLRKSHKSGLEFHLGKCYSRTSSNLYKDTY